MLWRYREALTHSKNYLFQMKSSVIYRPPWNSESFNIGTRISAPWKPDILGYSCFMFCEGLGWERVLFKILVSRGLINSNIFFRYSSLAESAHNVAHNVAFNFLSSFSLFYEVYCAYCWIEEDVKLLANMFNLIWVQAWSFC